MEVVLLTSGYDDGELEHRFKRTDAPAFDRIVTVNSSLLHFKMRKPGDGLLGANLRFQSRMDGRMTVLKYWAWKLDYDGVLLNDLILYILFNNSKMQHFWALEHRLLNSACPRK